MRMALPQAIMLYVILLYTSCAGEFPASELMANRDVVSLGSLCMVGYVDHPKLIVHIVASHRRDTVGIAVTS